MLLSVSLRLQCLQYPLHSLQGYQRVHWILATQVRNHHRNAAPTAGQHSAQTKIKHDFWSQVQTAYTVPSEGGRKLQFNDEVKGWAGIPQSGTFMDGFDTSQVSQITTKDAFYDSAHQSLSCTLFSSTPQSARRECLDAIERGLASKSLTVYFWKTKTGHLNKQLGIQCSHCQYAVHGKWTKTSSSDDIECLARFFVASLCPKHLGLITFLQCPFNTEPCGRT